MIQRWQEWSKGTLIADRYHIVETLGCGRVAITYLAFDENRKKQVAIKTIKPDILNSLTEEEITDFKDKFWREAVTLSRLKHNHIVSFVDAINDKKTNLVYIIMEYIEGISLANYPEMLSPKNAIKYIYQIGDALIYLHSNGKIHCNVKPSNIIIVNSFLSKKAVLIGFSLTQSFDHPLTQLNSSDADGFTAKELFVKEYTKGFFTDVYSLSATFYFLLTKKYPISVVNRILSQYGDKITTLFEEPQKIVKISDKVNYAIIKGLEIEPENRPKSIQEWLHLLGYKRYIYGCQIRLQIHILITLIEKLNPIITVVGIIVGIIGIYITVSSIQFNKPEILNPVEKNNSITD